MFSVFIRWDMALLPTVDIIESSEHNDTHSETANFGQNEKFIDVCIFEVLGCINISIHWRP